MIVKPISSIIDVFPRVLRVGKASKITVVPHFSFQQPSYLSTQGTLGLKFTCRNHVNSNGDYIESFYNKKTLEYLPFEVVGERFEFTFSPWMEEEYTFVIYTANADGIEKEQYAFSLYALEEDLFGLRPYKGDFHVHSGCSQCGKVTEPPELQVISACAKGLDFFALTDHGQYEPSQYLRQWCEKAGSACQILPGEECHSPREPLDTFFRHNAFLAANHIVSIGCREGVLDYIMKHYEEYVKAIAEASEKLPKEVGKQLRETMASADYIIDKIHEFGGIAIFAHPFWVTGHRTNLPQPVREYILKQGKYDAMEVLGLGHSRNDPDSANFSSREGNAVAAAWWQQENIKQGRMIPLVGTTDSHDVLECLGRHFTMVFAKECSTKAICEAVKQGRTIAFSNYEDDMAPFALGDFRLMKYAWFVFRELAPEHDEMLKAESAMLCEYIKGRLTADELRNYTTGRLDKFFSHVFAQE